MRIWDIPVENLCDRHLLGEHAELHAIWNIIIGNKKGYSTHPETRRWRGKLKALYIRHEKEKLEMAKRGFDHKSELNKKQATGKGIQIEFVDTLEEQKRILEGKGCGCMSVGVR